MIDPDDAVGNGATFNGSGVDELFIGRSGDDTRAEVSRIQARKGFFGQGGEVMLTVTRCPGQDAEYGIDGCIVQNQQQRSHRS